MVIAALLVTGLLVTWLVHACSVDMRGDASCDRLCMSPRSNYDSSPAGISDCSALCSLHCDLASLGNAHCDPGCESWDCGWDQGDCGLCAPGCALIALGDGMCQNACNTEECSFDLGDCVTKENPNVVYVSANQGNEGNGRWNTPFRSLSTALNSLWLPFNTVYMLSGNHTLESATSSQLLVQSGLKFTQISTLLCLNNTNNHPECSLTPATLHLAPDFPSLHVGHSVTISALILNGTFSLVEGCTKPTCLYCPYLSLDTELNAYVNDRGEVVDLSQYAQKTHCDPYRSRAFLQVTAQLTLSNVLFTSFKMQLSALIDNQCGDLVLLNVDFDNCIPSPTGLSTALITQSCPDQSAPYYCGNFSYIGGSVTRLNWGYEYRSDIVLSGFLSADGFYSVVISRVVFEFNFLPVGENATTSSSALILLGRFRTALVSNCGFHYNIANWSCGVTIVHNFKFPLIFDQNGVATEQIIPHFSMTNTTFTNNTSAIGTVLYVHFQAAHQNIHISNCTFRNNFSLLGGLIYVKNDQLVDRYASGADLDVMVAGALVHAKYPPRYVNITDSAFEGNYGEHMCDFGNVGNLVINNVYLYRNGEAYEDGLDSNTYVIRAFIAQAGSYVTAISLARPAAFVCEGTFGLNTVLSINIFSNIFKEINCPSGSPGLILSGKVLYTNIHSNVFSDSFGSGILTLRLVSALQLSNLTFANNTNYNDSSPVCLNIEMAKPADVSFVNCSFVGNKGDSATVGRFINAKSVLFDRVVIRNNAALYTSAGILFSPYPYDTSSLTIRNSEFVNNSADSFGVVTILDFQGVLSGNLYAIVSFNLDNCKFENNTSRYQGASLTLNNFIQFSANSTISNSKFLRNKSERGASISITYQTGTVNIQSCWFESNTSPEGGAGVFTHQYENLNGSTAVIIRNSVFFRNSGGAVIISGYAIVSDLYSFNNSFIENSGGAMVANVGFLDDSASQYRGNTGNSGPALSVQSSSRVTIRNGIFANNTAKANGGAIYIRSASQMTLASVQVTENRAGGSGGGIYCDSCDFMQVSNSIVARNTAGDKAGAIYSFIGRIVLTSSFVLSNQAGTYASIILIEGAASISDSTFSLNSASERTSGLLMSSSSLVVVSSTFTNQVSVNGGFILAMNNNNLRISNSTFLKGRALHNAGAIYLSLDSVMDISNVQFTDCSAKDNGGALLISGSTVQGTGLEFRNAEAANGGGIQSSESSLSLANCWFVNYTGGAVQAHTMRNLSLTSCQFEHSNGMAYRGAALYFLDNAQVTITSCSFRDNQGRRGGAAYFFASGSLTSNGIYTLKSNEFTDNLAYSGGALESDGVDLTLEANIFRNNTSLHSATSVATTNGNGGALVIRCQNPSQCTVVAKENAFIRNSASNNGGAIQWLETVPAFTLNTFDNNSATYGTDIASYAIALALLSDSLLPLPYEDNSTEVPTAFTLPNFVSGQSYLKQLKFGLFDHLGQRLSTDSSSLMEILGSSDISVAGQFKTNSYQGIFELTGFAITAQPGSTQLVQVSTNGVDLSLKAFNQDPARFVNTIAIKVVFRLCEAGESIQEHACVVCPAETYSLDPKAPCKTCISQATCYGGFLMVPKAGYWRARNDTDTFFECLNAEACTGSPEPPDVSLTGLCAEGYTGNLCQVCLPGYSRTGRNNCARCPSKTSNISVSLLIVAVALCGIALVIGFAIRGATRPRSLMAIYFKIFLNYLQMVVVAASLNLNWPSFTKTFLSTQEMAGGMADQLFSFECIMKDVSIADSMGMYSSKLIVGALLPAALCLIAVLAWLFLRLLKRVELLAAKIVTSFVIVVFIVHPSITKMMFSVYSCMTILPGEQWLVSDLSEKCWTSNHTRMILLISLPSIAVWVLGLPTLVLLLLVKSRHRLNESGRNLRFSFLYKGYEPQWFFWEFVILYRKIAIVASSVFLSVVSIKVQSLTVLAILLVSIYLQLRYQPFNDLTLNKLEVKSILVSAITIYAGLYYDTKSISKVYAGQVVNVLLFVVIIVANGYFLFTWLVYISPVLLAALRDHWRRLSKSRPNYRVQNFNSSLVELKDHEKSEISSSSIVVPSVTPLEGTQSIIQHSDSLDPPVNTPQLQREYTDPEDPTKSQHFSLR